MYTKRLLQFVDIPISFLQVPIIGRATIANWARTNSMLSQCAKSFLDRRSLNFAALRDHVSAGPGDRWGDVSKPDKVVLHTARQHGPPGGPGPAHGAPPERRGPAGDRGGHAGGARDRWGPAGLATTTLRFTPYSMARRVPKCGRFAKSFGCVAGVDDGRGGAGPGWHGAHDLRRVPPGGAPGFGGSSGATSQPPHSATDGRHAAAESGPAAPRGRGFGIGRGRALKGMPVNELTMRSATMMSQCLSAAMINDILCIWPQAWARF